MKSLQGSNMCRNLFNSSTSTLPVAVQHLLKCEQTSSCFSMAPVNMVIWEQDAFKEFGKAVLATRTPSPSTDGRYLVS